MGLQKEKSAKMEGHGETEKILMLLLALVLVYFPLVLTMG